MCEMRSSTAGRKTSRSTAKPTRSRAAAEWAPSLTAIRVAGETPAVLRALRRRDVEFGFDRVFVPSLIVDHTELVFRQAGRGGDEAFVIWAGTLADNDAHISTIVVPRSSFSPTHGEITAETSGHVLTSLDARDLVPILQLHTHPRSAFLSDTDAIRPIVAVSGFISVVIPDFGFVDLADVRLWSAHEFEGSRRWRELDVDERQRRLIVDDSLIRVEW
jgi:hypothetical protein